MAEPTMTREEFDEILLLALHECEHGGESPDQALERLRPHLDALLEADGPGTPLGRLNAIGAFAERECGHSPASSKPAELAVMEAFLEKQVRIKELERTLGIYADRKSWIGAWNPIDGEPFKSQDTWNGDGDNGWEVAASILGVKP